jgi:predicted nucleic acid-binding protein
LGSTKVFLAVMVLHTKEPSGMNGTKFFFDTCAVINLLNQKYDLSSLGIDIDEAQLLTSVIVRMELLSKRGMSNNEEKDILEFLDALTVIPLNETIEKKAIEIRRTASVKLPDSIIAATSIILNTILLTDDKDLLNLSLPGLRVQRIF